MHLIVSINLFANSHVIYWCWKKFWSALALGCGALWSLLDLLSGTTWPDDACLDWDKLLSRVDFWHVSSGGVIASDGIWKVGSRGRAMTVSAVHHFFGSGTFVVHRYSSRDTRPWSWTFCRWSKFHCSILGDIVDSPVFSLRSLACCRLVLSSYTIHDIRDISHLEDDAWTQITRMTRFGEKWRFVVSWMWELWQGVHLDCSVNSDITQGWT